MAAAGGLDIQLGKVALYQLSYARSRSRRSYVAAIDVTSSRRSVIWRHAADRAVTGRASSVARRLSRSSEDGRDRCDELGRCDGFRQVCDEASEQRLRAILRPRECRQRDDRSSVVAAGSVELAEA